LPGHEEQTVAESLRVYDGNTVARVWSIEQRLAAARITAHCITK
jgi:hypothetical protein